MSNFILPKKEPKRSRIRLVILLLCTAGAWPALWLHPLRAQGIPSEITVQPRVNTGAVSGDADDPAIWIHPTDPALSLVIGTDKAANFVYVWDMNGQQRQRVSIVKSPNNGDVRYGMPVSGVPVDIYVVGAEDPSRIVVFKIDPDTRQLSDITIAGGISVPQVKDPYGVCLYRRASDGAMFAFINSDGGVNGVLNQYQLLDNGAGKVQGVFVRSFGGDVNGEHSEGMVADDQLGYVYIAEEDCCVHKFHADPAMGNSRLAVFAQTDGIDPDREGLGIYGCADGTGYILLSSQGNERVKVYRREGDPGNPHSHTLLTTIFTPGVGGTDGLDVTNRPAGPVFPFGFLAKHDSDAKRFALFGWEDIAQNYLTICTDVTPCDVTANFSADFTSGCAALTVNFTDHSSGPATAWLWDFGDGNTSTAQSPSHTYAAAGTYTVQLTATSEACSDNETKTGYIVVRAAPVAAFAGAPLSGNAPLAVTFTDQSTNAPTSWSWDFGDGGTSTLQNPSYTYNAAGDYTVQLTAANDCGADAETKTAYIHVDPCVPPVAAFSASPLAGSVPLTVNFTDQSTGNTTAWSWNFGDGAVATTQNPSHQYTSPGTYTVTLTVSNACGVDDEIKTNYITVNSTPVNIALNKPATASSTNGSNVPGRAVDGSTSTFWRSGSVSTNTVVWWRVDLGAAQTINRAVIKWRSSYYATRYDIQVSTNGTTFTNVFTTNSGNGGTDDVSFAPVSARYVRVYMRRNNTSSERIDEVEVYGGSGVLPKEGGGEGNSIVLLPEEIELDQNYPNPFNPSTTISYSLPEEARVELAVVNLMGEKIATLVSGTRPAGRHTVTFTPENLPSGIYFCVLHANEMRLVRRLLYMR